MGKGNSWNSRDELLKSLALMAVASLIDRLWSLNFNQFMAQIYDLDMENQARTALAQDRDFQLERDVMAYVEAMSRTLVTVSDVLSTLLQEQLSAPALIDLPGVIDFVNRTTRCNMAPGIDLEVFANSCS
ncbi:hypothetical protein [Glutamicibacter sp. 0426]|uniref:hypothetical protein n=1 Tax=Glutamicibacter sp. 0426 TaxID=1913445 RepID=UPI0009FB2B06|nr:hypothetical protein [Glutamicibacter sp. 0426]